MKLYTKLNGKLAVYEIDTNDRFVAWNMLKKELGPQHRSAIMIVIDETSTSNSSPSDPIAA